jgi:glutamyl-tRNA reductase
VSLVVIGLNHRTAPLDLLERMSIDDTRLTKALADLIERPHVTEAVILSTCNRTEVYAYVEKFHGAYQDVREFLSAITYQPPELFADHLYAHYDQETVRHLFRVASGLDSAVVGENEVLGQVRRAWETSQQEHAAGPVLAPLFRHAVETGKRARTETTISRNIASVSQAAIAMARQRLDSLEGISVLVLGAGEMGEGLVRSLHDAGVSSIAIANRTWENAVELAGRAGGTPVRLTELHATLDGVDLLVTSTGASALMVEANELSALMTRREGRPLLIVDIAVPRDVDPLAGSIEGITLLDMNDLRAFADSGIRERQREVSAVEVIIEQEVERYSAYATAREVAPLIAALHGRADEIRDSELERFASRLSDLSPKEREAVEALVQGVIGKMLYRPTVRLKDAAGSARGERLADALRDLFDL